MKNLQSDMCVPNILEPITWLGCLVETFNMGSSMIFSVGARGVDRFSFERESESLYMHEYTHRHGELGRNSVEGICAH